MTVLDAQAVLAYALEERAADPVESLLREGGCRISAANVAEVIDILIRVRGRSPDEVDAFLELLAAGGLVIVPVDASIGRAAGRLRSAHYDRRTRALSLGDCVALATALATHDRLATSDRPLAQAAEDEGGTVIALTGLADRT